MCDEKRSSKRVEPGVTDAAWDVVNALYAVFQEKNNEKTGAELRNEMIRAVNELHNQLTHGGYDDPEAVS